MFFIAPGPLTVDLFANGFDTRMALWLTVVLVGTGIAGLLGRLPGVEPRPYIIRFTEDRPNPIYRRVCYTLAWSELIAFARAEHRRAGRTPSSTGTWRLRQIYEVAYFPIVGVVWALGAFGLLPRVKPSTEGEGHERRYFYGSVWAVAIAQPILGVLWKVLPQNRRVRRAQARRLCRRSSRTSATSRAAACCRGRGRSFRASSRCRTEKRLRLRARGSAQSFDRLEASCLEPREPRAVL